MGEWCALNVARETICVSERLAEEYVAEGHRVTYVPNGIALNNGDDTSILDELGVSDGGYLLFAGRGVPEKGAHYLIEAWRAAGRPLPLVIAGDTSFSDEYVSAVKASQSEGVLFPGYVYGARLAALFRHAALFVLPSDLEGLPIVLLEALGYGAPVLASDIVPNVEVLGDKGRYFEAGDIESLTRELSRAMSELGGLRDRAGAMREEALAEYDWDRVTDMTLDVYDRAVGARGGT
jgi:glycosyltransferase involved in cell wall biosynthesis